MFLLPTFGKKLLTTERRKFAQWQIFTRRCSKSNAMVIGFKISMLSTLGSAFLFMSDSSDSQAQTKIFLATGRNLEGKACASPVRLSAAEWQIAGRKIWNWGEKNLHIRDAQVVADELLAEPDVKTLEPKVKALPAQRIAVIGHSFTMDLHWSSPSAFVPIVTAMMARENPGVQFRQFQAGGLTSSRAMKNFYQDALAWQPNTVLFVLVNRTDQDLADLRTMAKGFRAAGARVIMFDDVHDPDSTDPKMRDKGVRSSSRRRNRSCRN